MLYRIIPIDSIVNVNVSDVDMYTKYIGSGSAIERRRLRFLSSYIINNTYNYNNIGPSNSGGWLKFSVLLGDFLSAPTKEICTKI